MKYEFQKANLGAGNVTVLREEHDILKDISGRFKTLFPDIYGVAFHLTAGWETDLMIKLVYKPSEETGNGLKALQLTSDLMNGSDSAVLAAIAASSKGTIVPKYSLTEEFKEFLGQIAYKNSNGNPMTRNGVKIDYKVSTKAPAWPVISGVKVHTPMGDMDSATGILVPDEPYPTDSPVYCLQEYINTERGTNVSQSIYVHNCIDMTKVLSMVYGEEYPAEYENSNGEYVAKMHPCKYGFVFSGYNKNADDPKKHRVYDIIQMCQASTQLSRNRNIQQQRDTGNGPTFF